MLRRICNFDVDRRELYVGKLKNTCTSNFFNRMPSPVLEAGYWYLMKLTMVGNVISCELSGDSLQGTTRIEITDPDPIISGAPGINTDGSAMSFDNIIVRSL